MLQIAIWGIAMMLVIKGLDVLHRDAIAAKAGHGDPKFAWAVCILAAIFACALVYLAGEQVKNSSTATPPPFGVSAFDGRNAAEKAAGSLGDEERAKIANELGFSTEASEEAK
jgi:hypothetical protein